MLDNPEVLHRLAELRNSGVAVGLSTSGTDQSSTIRDAIGIEIDGRVGVLYSNKDYGCEWDYDYRNKRWLAVDNTRFGVNVVMYALTS